MPMLATVSQNTGTSRFSLHLQPVQTVILCAVILSSVVVFKNVAYVIDCAKAEPCVVLMS